MIETTVKKTPLSDWHEVNGGKMVDFAGYLMPVQYEGVIKEHLNVRTNVGAFDVSHMGEFLVSGPQALNLIQWVCSNDASKLVDGKVQYSCFPNDSGGIVDDLLVYRFSQNEYMLVVNASNIEKDWNWIQSQNKFDATIEDISDDTALIAVQGPKAALAIQSLTSIDLSEMKYYTFKKGSFAGNADIIVSSTGYTGAGGFEVYIPSLNALNIWNAILESGKSYGLKPTGLASRDTLRLEMGFCLYGNDIDDHTSPLEAGLGWITKFTKNFVNSKNLLEEKEQGIKKKLVGFEMIDRGIPRKDYEILDEQGNSIGRVTSGTNSPSLNKSIGMGYVTKENSIVDSEIHIAIRNKTVRAKIVKLPFLNQ